MNLHKDKTAFSTLLTTFSERANIRADILEKDYYVTLMLKELAHKQEMIPAYFKGGTALYKALGNIRRFSEDIDLTVEIGDCNNSQAKKRIESVSKFYSSLNRTDNKELETDKKGNITSVYEYTPIMAVDSNDELQRFGYVKVEATSFTVSEPYETKKIFPIIYDLATEDEQEKLKEYYGVESFEIKVITLERIFVDKVFAAEFYFVRNDYKDVSKHIYDISVLITQPVITGLLNDYELFGKLIGFKRDEESRRIGSDLAKKRFEDFIIFDEIENDDMKQAFEHMQDIYVFKPEDKIDFETAAESLKSLKDVFIGQDPVEEPEQDEEENLGITMF